ncbi:MAG: DUF349 domain-containing protein [Candidatus Cryptobacteroides sp.]|nr:DUF349 domain-containing protein [Candidatus Cryptobacteroides sp.]
MSEEIIPEVNVEANVPSDVPEPAEMAPVVEAAAVNYQEMGIPELVAAFEQLAKSEDRMQRAKEADAIKSAFYKKLIKAKSEAGIDPESAEENPFTGIEEAFKAYYNAFKKEKAEYNKAQEAERERNLALKQAVIEDLKQLLEKQEDVKVTFPEFRSIQDRWKAVGPVPVQNFRNLNETYQLYVEQFYDMVNINRELRDLDFKKNLEAKTAFCEEAEALAQRSDVVEAFRELQKLHEQWKDYGPVEKQYRESIWERFKAATAVINRNYQAHFEGLKEQQEANLVAKTALCEKAEAIAAAEMANANEWNAATKTLEEIQKEWRGIGFASKKDNQKIYDRFRAACDAFFARKKEFYAGFKESINENLARKLAICEQAEALKDSTDWKATADTLIDLQKQWKEIGAVPRQKSDALWKRFRAACDSFFEARDKQPKDANDYYGNLKAKQRLIAEINAYELSGDAEADAEAGSKFSERWQAIGFVPFKEKDRIAQAYREAMAKFNAGRGASRRQRPERTPMTEKERLVKKYNQLEQDIVTYENNLGFFARSKNAEPLIRQMEERIAKAKEELRSLEAEIRSME